MASVTRITPEVRALRVPAPLIDLPAYLVWRYESYEGEPKPRKVPYWAGGGRRHGQQGSPVDRARLTTFAAAREAAARKGFDGVGFALLPDWGITALDFDNCVGPDGSLPSEIERIAAGTYAEYSPSGKGIRAFLRGDLGNNKAPTKDGAYGVETFSSTGFVTVTGDMLPGVELLGHEDTVAPVDQFVTDLCLKRFGRTTSATNADDFMAGYEPRLGLTIEQMEDALGALDAGMGRDDWRTVGMALHHETQGDDTGFELWHEWSEGAHNYSGEESMRYQWDRFHEDGAGRRRVTMASVLKMANEARGKPVDAEVLKAQEPAEPDSYDGKFRPIRAGMLSSVPPRWLIRDVLPRTEDPVIIFGSSTAGKTFVCIELCAAIARGVEWRGHKVEKGRILYITAEGGRGFRARIQAYCQQHVLRIDELDIDVLNAAVNIMEADDVKELVRAIMTFGRYDVVVIDTLAQVTPGANENAGEDMSRALANIKAVQRATGSTVIVVHHAGKDVSKGSRGWSGIKAAAEAQIEVFRDEVTNERHIRIDKLKDGIDGTRYGFKLETVVVDRYEDGSDYTSCVVVETELSRPSAPGPGKRRDIGRRGKHQVLLLEIIEGLPTGTTSMRVDEIVDLAMRHLPPPETGPDSRRRRLTDALIALSKERPEAPIGIKGNQVLM